MSQEPSHPAAPHPTTPESELTQEPTSEPHSLAAPLEPPMNGPVVDEPVVSGPTTLEPVTTEPVTTEPVTTEPVTTEPVTTEPVTTEPATPEVRPRWFTTVRLVLFFLGYVMLSGIASGLAVVFAAYLFDAGDALMSNDPMSYASVPLGPEWQDSVMTMVSLAGVALSFPAIFLLTWLMVRYLDRATLADIGCRWPLVRSGDERPVWRPSFALALRRFPLWILATACLLGVWLAIAALGGIEFNGLADNFSAGPGFLPGVAGSLLLLVALFVLFMIQGSVEEWAFRGYMQGTMMRSWGFWVATVVSSLLFMFLHMGNPGANPFGMVNTFLIGIVFAQLWYVTGSLWAPCVIHGAWNFLLGTFVSLPVSGIEVLPVFDLRLTGPWWLTGGDYGAEGSAVLTAMSLLLIYLLWRLQRRVDVDRMWATAAQKTGPEAVETPGYGHGETSSLDSNEVTDPAQPV